MKLPSHWRAVTLSDLSRSINNGIFTSRPSVVPPGVKILRISSVRGGKLDVDDVRYVRDDDGSLRKRFTVGQGDLLLTRYNGTRSLVGICALVPNIQESIIHPDKLIRVRLRDGVLPAFVALQLQSPQVRKFLEPRIRTTAGQSGISGKDVKSIPLVLPTLSEQYAIVETLEDHLSRIDVADSGLAVSARQLENLRISVLSAKYRSFLESGVGELGVGAVCETALGKMLDSKRAAGEPTRYLRNINVRWGSLDLNEVREVPLVPSERADLALKAGDILVCEGGEPGRCAVWPGSEQLMTYQKALHRLRVKDSGAVDPYFVALMIEQAVRSGRARALFTGTTIKHLSQEKLRRLGVPVPTIADQRRCVEAVRQMQDQANVLAAASSVSRAKSTALRRALLTAAFSGRLTGVRDVSEVVEEMAGV